MDISIIIPTHNRAEILSRTLGCLEKQIIAGDIQVELIIVANNCTDNTVGVSEQALQRMPFSGRVIEEFEAGLNPARNRGVRESIGKVCALIDDDVSFENNWICEIVTFFNESPADVAGGRVTLWWDAVDRPEWFTPTLDSLLSYANKGDKTIEISSHIGIVGANMWFRKSVWTELNGFLPGLDRVGNAALGGGDSDFVERSIKAGFKAYHTPSGALLHWVAPGRIEEDYLLRVATGTARGRVLMKPTMSMLSFTYSLVGHTYLLASNGLKAWFSSIKDGRKASITYAAKSRVGLGGLLALYDRLKR